MELVIPENTFVPFLVQYYVFFLYVNNQAKRVLIWIDSFLSWNVLMDFECRIFCIV